jgi:hypothetical protein
MTFPSIFNESRRPLKTKKEKLNKKTIARPSEACEPMRRLEMRRVYCTDMPVRTWRPCWSILCRTPSGCPSFNPSFHSVQVSSSRILYIHFYRDTQQVIGNLACYISLIAIDI